MQSKSLCKVTGFSKYCDLIIKNFNNLLHIIFLHNIINLAILPELKIKYYGKRH